MCLGSEGVFGFLSGGQQMREDVVCSRLDRRKKATISFCDQGGKKRQVLMEISPLRSLFTRRSSRSLSRALAKPHQAGDASSNKFKVVALVTTWSCCGCNPCFFSVLR